MERKIAKKEILKVIKKVDDTIYAKIVALSEEDFTKVKLSEYFDSLEFMIFDYELISKFPAYLKEQPFSKECTLGEVCNFVMKKF